MDEVNKNVLYISYDGMTDPLGQSQVLPYLIGLSENGYSFDLISFEKKERFNTVKNTIIDICEKANIVWYPMTYSKRPPVVSTIWDMFKLNQKIKSIGKKKEINLIHCRSYLPAIFGMKYKKKWTTSFLFDMRGFWANERVDGKIWNIKTFPYNYIYRYFKKKEKLFFRHADHTVSLTSNGKNEILSWVNAESFSPISVIPCCSDLNLFEIQNKSSDLFIIGYLGSLGTWYMLDEMLLFFKEILKLKPNALFHFITKDPAEKIHENATQHKIPLTSLIIEQSERSEIPKKTKDWSLSLIFILPSYSKKASSPTKQGELMAMGIPVVCNKNVGDTDHLVQKYKSGFVLESFEFKTINFSEFINTKFDKSKIRAGAIDYFSLKKGIAKYLSIYNKIT